MVLLGALAFGHRRWLSFGLITVGCLAGAVATMWTLVIPLVALAVIVLVLLRAGEEIDRLSADE